MRAAHGADAFLAMESAGKSDDVPDAFQPQTGAGKMFIRAVWRTRRLVDMAQTLRKTTVPTARNADLLGVCGPDFAKMTAGLFDRRV